MNLHQVELRRGDVFTVVWVDASLKLKVGDHIIGKDGEEWEVYKTYTVQTIDDTKINRNWHVGGLT